MQKTSAAPGSCYFYYPRLVAVVGIRDEHKDTCNFAPVAWASPLSSDPPFFGICLSPRTYSYQLVLRSGEFSINFLGHEDAALCDALGALSGRETDKVKALQLELEAPETLATPTLSRAYAAAECLLVERHQIGDQTLFVGEVQRIHTRNDVFDADGLLRVDRTTPLLYLGNKRYVTADPASVVRPEPE